MIKEMISLRHINIMRGVINLMISCFRMVSNDINYKNMRQFGVAQEVELELYLKMSKTCIQL